MPSLQIFATIANNLSGVVLGALLVISSMWLMRLRREMAKGMPKASRAIALECEFAALRLAHPVGNTGITSFSTPQAVK